MQIRGARVAAAFLSAIPAIAVAILLLQAPRGGIVPVRYTWDWPIYGDARGLARRDRVLDPPRRRVDDIKVARGTSKGQTVH